jgi:4-amino-4-deoxy-L-arabinose transferase-like glycosyltransferase
MMTKRRTLHYSLAIVLLIVVGLLRISSTYSALWQTWDEPAHIARGMEWIDKGEYTYSHEHPPLSPIMVALGPYFAGARSTGQKWRYDEGNNLLHYENAYERNLTLARLGVLPFFVIATLIVWIWTKSYFGRVAALLSVILFSTLPPVLAHSGVATTDMAITAMFVAALFSFYLWLESPTLLRSAMLGITIGLACLAKYSVLVFLPASASLLAIVHYSRKINAEEKSLFRIRRWLAASGMAVLLCLLVIWAGYRFSSAALTGIDKRPHTSIDRIVGAEGLLHDTAYLIAENVPLPAPEFFSGIRDVATHNKYGHVAYLLGEAYTEGRWYFFPIELSVRTPVPFLILTAIGLLAVSRHVMVRRRDMHFLAPGAAALGVLAVCMLSNLNLGIRHILPMFPLLAVVAGYGAIMLWKFRRSQRFGPALLTILLIWQITSSFAAHPDYLAYYNELAGVHPEDIVLGTTDWGQDVKRLAAALKNRKIEELSICYYGSADLDRLGLPPRKDLVPYQRTTGWIASSLLCSKMGAFSPPYDQFSWLDAHEPVETAGKTIRLYYIPE